MTWNSGRMLDGPGAQYISTSAYPEPVVMGGQTDGGYRSACGNEWCLLVWSEKQCASRAMCPECKTIVGPDNVPLWNQEPSPIIWTTPGSALTGCRRVAELRWR